MSTTSPMSTTRFLLMFHTPGLARQVLLERRAHAMRFSPTPSEALLWSRLRARQLGVVFRRQVVIGNFIIDFGAPSASLIVEVDGDAYHNQRTSSDAARDRKLVLAGYKVLRIPASLVERQLADAVARVAEALYPALLLPLSRQSQLGGFGRGELSRSGGGRSAVARGDFYPSLDGAALSGRAAKSLTSHGRVESTAVLSK